MRSGAEARRLFWAATLGLLAADFATKRIAERVLLPIPPVELAGEWLQLRLVYNQGAAFGIHLGPWSRWIFLLIAAAAIVLLLRLARSSPARDLLRQLSCGLVAGGAAGNLVDRVRTAQGVVDFIDVGIGAHRWPTFNVADMGVSCGAIALAISLWLEDARRSRREAASSA
ncbi:MAG TPA: signal peptidase II [Gemmatimonadales bacterium]|jgi:signal peptidase II|nr:signal peptidase II [Gemmatimonadales bacterium]